MEDPQQLAERLVRAASAQAPVGAVLSVTGYHVGVFGRLYFVSIMRQEKLTGSHGETQIVSHLQNSGVRNCAVAGCTGRAYAAHDFCTMHQLRYERTGNPLLARKRGRKKGTST
jgi:hypothetical protein